MKSVYLVKTYEPIGIKCHFNSFHCDSQHLLKAEVHNAFTDIFQATGHMYDMINGDAPGFSPNTRFFEVEMVPVNKPGRHQFRYFAPNGHDLSYSPDQRKQKDPIISYTDRGVTYCWEPTFKHWYIPFNISDTSDEVWNANDREITVKAICKDCGQQYDVEYDRDTLNKVGLNRILRGENGKSCCLICRHVGLWVELRRQQEHYEENGY